MAHGEGAHGVTPGRAHTARAVHTHAYTQYQDIRPVPRTAVLLYVSVCTVLRERSQPERSQGTEVERWSREASSLRARSLSAALTRGRLSARRRFSRGGGNRHPRCRDL